MTERESKLILITDLTKQDNSEEEKAVVRLETIFKKEMNKDNSITTITTEEDIEIMPMMTETIMETATREEDMITATIEDMRVVVEDITMTDKIIIEEIEETEEKEIMIEIYTAFCHYFAN